MENTHDQVQGQPNHSMVATTSSSQRSIQTTTTTNPSTRRAPRLSVVHPTPTTMTSKPSLKKRSKSLGGPALEQHILRPAHLHREQESLTLTFELTPRKKARRSLVGTRKIYPQIASHTHRTRTIDE